jgi:hypothetical protein
VVSSEAFGRYVAQIWSDLREEATRGMQDEETRALHAAPTPPSPAQPVEDGRKRPDAGGG